MIKKICDFLYDRIYYSLATKCRKIYEKYYFCHLRKRLNVDEFSLFSPNCYAGIIYHRLGKRFLSPTINTLFPSKKQYLNFLSNLKYYLEQELVFIEDSNFTAPVAMLDDVKIVFVHYDTREEAEIAWNKRKTRVNFDKLLFVFDDISDADYDDIVSFNNLGCRGKVVFSANQYSDIPCVVQLKKYKKHGRLKPYLLDVNHFTGRNGSDKYFDFVSWINESFKS